MGNLPDKVQNMKKVAEIGDLGIYQSGWWLFKKYTACDDKKCFTESRGSKEKASDWAKKKKDWDEKGFSSKQFKTESIETAKPKEKEEMIAKGTAKPAEEPKTKMLFDDERCKKLASDLVATKDGTGCISPELKEKMEKYNDEACKKMNKDLIANRKGTGCVDTWDLEELNK